MPEWFCPDCQTYITAFSDEELYQKVKEHIVQHQRGLLGRMKDLFFKKKVEETI